ncbi:unnamed protein product [Strongylus vulgaris]|uniref:FAS1 domain-containing protein n=1 Tax=Strongylus vulgaris TaxID=40348 RepID=A0A3P7KLI1_STRVU|nr:unnamed protein product [Strongylus vulgaris]
MDGTELKTINGGKLIISQTADALGTVRTYVNCVPMNSTSIRTKNGVLHTVSGDLVPAADTVLAALESDPRFTSFKSLLSDDSRQLLSSNESFTVFAPLDKVFSSLPDSLLLDIKERRGCASGEEQGRVIPPPFWHPGSSLPLGLAVMLIVKINPLMRIGYY